MQRKTNVEITPAPPLPEADLSVLWAGYPDRMVPHSTLREALELSVGFNEDESPGKGRYLSAQLDDFASSVRDVPGYAGVFATGYPFYAWKNDGGVNTIPEISRYIHSYLETVDEDAQRQYGAWICGACQLTTGLPDLKTLCRPCDAVTLKPRDVFKALPDLDFWVIVDDEAVDTDIFEKEVEARTSDEGFTPSDKDIGQAVYDTLHVMQTLRRGNVPMTRLPIDLHVVTKTALLDRMKRVPGALRDSREVPVDARSLHVTWEGTDEPYDFLKDYLFSMSPRDWRDPELMQTLETTRQQAKKVIGSNAVQIVSRLAPKEARQLETPAIGECLEERIKSW